MDDRKLADILVRHALASEKYGKGLADKIVRLLNSGDADLVAQIAARYVQIEGSGLDRGPATTKRLNDLLEAVRATNAQVYSRIADALPVELQKVAGHESDFATRAAKSAGASISTATTLPSPQFLRTLVETSPIDGRLLGSWINGLEAARLDRLEQAVRIGLLQGESTDGLIKRIRGTKANGYRDGILDISRRSAQTLAITANATVQNAARLETFRNMAGINFVEWSAILDSRTSAICQSLSGQIWPIDAPHPTPPAHPRCRSMLLPRKNDTDPPLHQPYHEWLKGKSADVQDHVLGKGRGKLYRDGKISRDDLYRQDGSFKTLAELEQHDAGIVPKEEAAPFTSPINRATTAETIDVQSKREIVKQLSGGLLSGADDARYSKTPEFRSVKPEQFGRAQLSSEFTDEAASMIAALKPELDAISDVLGVPRLRGIKSISGNRAIATMGDGILSVNSAYFNAYAKELGGAEAKAVDAKLLERRDALAKELKAESDAIAQIKIELRDLTGVEKDAKTIEYIDRAEAFNVKRNEWLKLDQKIWKTTNVERVTSKPVNEWKPGDDPKLRPFGATDYFESGLDKARNVLFHEMGHQVHQMYRKLGLRRAFGEPPLEQELKSLFRKLRNYDKLPSNYSKANAFEWWAESFGLWMMGRHELVDPEVAKLIERLLNEVKNGRK